MKNRKLKQIVLASVLLLSSCGFMDHIKQSVVEQTPVPEVPVYTAEVKKTSYPAVRTPQGTNRLDLETPLRCFVNWETQQMISTVPYNIKAFNLVRNGKNDMLPRFEVNGFSFETMSAEKALLKLTKEAGLKLVAKDAP